DLNARLWAWVEQVYHRQPHSALGNRTPLSRYQQDLPRIRLLGVKVKCGVQRRHDQAASGC
ncbi:hypothetical protein V4C53_47920, partial [Paraburkholderia azotifigens]